MCQKNYVSQGAIPPYRIVKFGSADRTVVVASAATDLLMGVSGRYKDNVVAGGQIDVIRDDFCEVELGGTVVRGEALTADANGKAITATVTGSRIIGYAEVSGVAGDIIWMMVELSKI